MISRGETIIGVGPRRKEHDSSGGGGGVGLRGSGEDTSGEGGASTEGGPKSN